MTRSLIVGNPVRAMENRRFLSPNNAKIPAIDQPLLQAKKAKSKAFRTLDYEPIVPSKKRQEKTLKIRKPRRLGQSIDAAKKGASLVTAEVSEMDALVDENTDLRLQIANMVEVFEQYLKVATLKDTAERMQGKKIGEQDEEEQDGG